MDFYVTGINLFLVGKKKKKEEVKAMIWIPLGRNFRERSGLTKGIFVKFLFGHI